MPLPKAKFATFETQIPSTKQKIQYRQFQVAEEKILLMAKSSEDEGDIFKAIKQIVNNCVLDDIDIDELCTFDIEYMFIKIRAVSVGNVIELTFQEGDGTYKFFVDLDEVKVTFPDNTTNIVQITEDQGIELRYPPASLFDSRNTVMTGVDAYEYLAAKSIVKIFDGDEVFLAKDCSEQELLSFINTLDSASYQSVKKFLSSIPRIQHTVEYTDRTGVQRKLELNTLTDFFTF